MISVGKNNRYGHSNKEVLNNLKKSKIYRTDQDESIMFKIINNKLRLVVHNHELTCYNNHRMWLNAKDN